MPSLIWNNTTGFEEPVVQLRQWLARPSGRAFLAGEHTSLEWQGCMNGAVETGLRAARAKYHHSVTPISSTVRDGATIVIGRVAGDFPNSPIQLDHIFRLDGDKIASLEIG